jgi:hypothetical protein
MLFISTRIFDDKLRPQILSVGNTANSPLKQNRWSIVCFICGQGHQQPDIREPQSPLQQQQQQVTCLCICYQSRRNCVATSIIGLGIAHTFSLAFSVT